MSKKEKLKNYDAYWKFINELDDFCIKALDDLFADDIMSALDRVKTSLMQEQVKIQMMDELEEKMLSGDEEEESTPIINSSIKLDATNNKLKQNIEDDVGAYIY